MKTCRRGHDLSVHGYRWRHRVFCSECKRLMARPHPVVQLLPMDADALARFWAKVSRDSATGCWNWTGAVRKGGTDNGGGYGRFWTSTHVEYAHRVSYRHFVGPIPADRELHHRCENRRCVNPEHLALVTHTGNMRRGPNATKTHCKRGHEFTPENTEIQHHKRGWTLRGCRECRRTIHNVKHRAA